MLKAILDFSVGPPDRDYAASPGVSKGSEVTSNEAKQSRPFAIASFLLRQACADD
jgi:hypothetical protein